MSKVLNILTASILLLATTTGKLTVFQCLIDGSFGLTTLCCLDQNVNVEENSCCSHDSETQEVVEKETFLISDACCVEIDVESDFLSDIEMNAGLSESSIVSKLMTPFRLLPVFLKSEKSPIINGPPDIFLKNTPTNPIYIKLCTFLC